MFPCVWRRGCIYSRVWRRASVHSPRLAPPLHIFPRLARRFSASFPAFGAVTSYPRLAPIAGFPAFGAGSMFYGACWRRLQVSLRLAPVTRVWRRFRVFPRLSPVATVSASSFDWFCCNDMADVYFHFDSTTVIRTESAHY